MGSCLLEKQRKERGARHTSFADESHVSIKRGQQEELLRWYEGHQGHPPSAGALVQTGLVASVLGLVSRLVQGTWPSVAHVELELSCGW